ncbi:MAG: glycosyltransferase family 8 protein [Treponema sp.]|nr:glycosyltransferase family 8 protein [Treponema sp.]
MEKSDIPIVFAANNYYVPYMATMIQSVMETAGHEKQYVFYILHQEIDDNNMELLKKQISNFHQFSIKFINVSSYISKYNLYVSRHITVESYFRLLIPELLPEYKKAVYLDGDMICCTDIAELFNINIEKYLLASVRDTAVALYYSKKEENYLKSRHQILLKLKNPDEYFNGGMCLFNIELFRNTISTKELIELAASRQWPVHDQDVLNYLADSKVLLLPYHWNCMTMPLAEYLPKHLFDNYCDAKNNPKIIHFNAVKPWNCYTYITNFELFWKHATRTPFSGAVIDRMKLKGFTSDKSLKDMVISNIIKRNGIGIRFILFDCIKAWLSRKKTKK